jgi:hypothetical protein
MSGPNDRQWEAVAAARLQRNVDSTVARIRATADDIECEAKRNIEMAAQETHEFSTYARAAGAVIHSLHTLMFNVSADNLIDAAADADQAHREKKRTEVIDSKAIQSSSLRKVAQRQALATLLSALDGWIEGGKSNHEASGHRHENRGEECWRQYAPDDIRRIVNDAARELGISEFPAPESPEEDK